MPSEEGAQRRRTFAEAFDPRVNSLNLLRLVFATIVVLGHSTVVFDFGVHESIRDRTTVATLGIFGFFAISGFLIARSADRIAPLDYLRRRALRIFPGFWVALVVVALGIAAFSWTRAPGLPDCDLGCYFGITDGGPWSYLWRNAALWIAQPGIARTPADYLFFGWNLPLWSLVYEFGCYLLVLLLAIVGVLRRGALLLVVTGAIWAAEIVVTVVPELNAKVNLFSYPVVLHSLNLVPIFLVGSCLWVWRSKVPDSGWLAALCGAGFVASLWLPVGAVQGTFSLSSACIAAPLLVYPVLWLGWHLPFTKVGRRNDYSYGVYIYAYPLQLLLVVLGVQSLGLIGFNLVTLVVTALFAFASWHLVEKPCQRLAHRVRSRPEEVHQVQNS